MRPANDRRLFTSSTSRSWHLLHEHVDLLSTWLTNRSATHNPHRQKPPKCRLRQPARIQVEFMVVLCHPFSVQIQLISIIYTSNC
ncbi:hypothetical protein A0H81_06662 [Grifola frondosa]|uniref:Uncharacterized protein n=1 Tax=Grifola frondosa TaxID=5627 RepID=A0A1C7M9D8_GRIFR|nr:hypothetical protein A0H81_06662 [Grifola frondosa]